MSAVLIHTNGETASVMSSWKEYEYGEEGQNYKIGDEWSLEKAVGR